MPLVEFAGRCPDLHPGSQVTPGCWLIGEVHLHPGASVWYTAVLRADGAPIIIGADSNIQDGAVLHADPGLPVSVGERVTVGHRAVLHGCTIGDDVLVGMGATIMNGARIGSGSIVAAGSVVLEDSRIPANSLVTGIPAKLRRVTTARERAHILDNANNYVRLKDQHPREADS